MIRIVIQKSTAKIVTNKHAPVEKENRRRQYKLYTGQKTPLGN